MKNLPSRATFSSRICVFVLTVIYCSTWCCASLPVMDITAYEYQQKFHKSLDLGECPHREVPVKMPNGSVHVEPQRCYLHKRGLVNHLPREMNHSRNVLISSADDIVNYLTLCGGEVASFLGILHSGDCVAVEIASQLTFNRKTVVRAFVGYYWNSWDILNSSNNLVRDGMESHYKDKYYLKKRSYGTLELIFVQFRFSTIKQASAATATELTSDPTMSAYMEKISDEAGTPKSVTIISLSTAMQEKYRVKKEKEWARALRYVQILELQIQKTRARINAGEIKPHLKYQLFPFIEEEGKTAPRLSNPITWKKTTMLEVQLLQSISIAQKAIKKCGRNQSRLCRRVSGLQRKLVRAKAEVHKVRSNWANLTQDEKRSFASKFNDRVKTYSRMTKKLARKVRTEEKLAKLKSKRNRANEIPTFRSRSKASRRKSSYRHHVRHSNKKRNRRLRLGRLRNYIKA